MSDLNMYITIDLLVLSQHNFELSFGPLVHLMHHMEHLRIHNLYFTLPQFFTKQYKHFIEAFSE